MMRKMFQIKSVRNRIILFTVGVLVFLTLGITIPFSYVAFRSEMKNIAELEQRMNDNFDFVLKSELETVLTMLSEYQQMIARGEMGADEAQQHAAQLLRTIKFGDNGYFFVYDPQGTCLVLLGDASIEGTNRISLVDSYGTQYVKGLVDAALTGDGFSEYWYPKAGETEPSPKRAYSRFFEPFGWVVGTGNYIDDIGTIIGELQTERQASFRRMLWLVAIIAFFAIVFGVVIAWVMGNSIGKPLVDLSGKANRLASGDLNVVIDTHSSDEVGVLSDSLGTMVEQLRSIVDEISSGSANVVAASQQMSSSSQMIADGASEQAASTEQISTSLEEMTASILQNNENAKTTQAIAISTGNGILELKNAFQETLNAMQQIAERIKFIQDISLQTNLLALNAAVEAARAGEAGRGFNVVAAEVRKLSDNTKKAAFDIDVLTTSSLGVAQDTWDLLEKLIPEFQKTVDLVEEISASGAEQSAGVVQINNAINQLVNITSQNSAAAEEMASAAEELASQSEALKDSVGFFRLE